MQEAGLQDIVANAYPPDLREEASRGIAADEARVLRGGHKQ